MCSHQQNMHKPQNTRKPPSPTLPQSSGPSLLPSSSYSRPCVPERHVHLQVHVQVHGMCMCITCACGHVHVHVHVHAHASIADGAFVDYAVHRRASWWSAFVCYGIVTTSAASPFAPPRLQPATASPGFRRHGGANQDLLKS